MNGMESSAFSIIQNEVGNEVLSYEENFFAGARNVDVLVSFAGDDSTREA